MAIVLTFTSYASSPEVHADPAASAREKADLTAEGVGTILDVECAVFEEAGRFDAVKAGAAEMTAEERRQMMDLFGVSATCSMLIMHALKPNVAGPEGIPMYPDREIVRPPHSCHVHLPAPHVHSLAPGGVIGCTSRIRRRGRAARLRSPKVPHQHRG